MILLSCLVVEKCFRSMIIFNLSQIFFLFSMKIVKNSKLNTKKKIHEFAMFLFLLLLFLQKSIVNLKRSKKLNYLKIIMFNYSEVNYEVVCVNIFLNFYFTLIFLFYLILESVLRYSLHFYYTYKARGFVFLTTELGIHSPLLHSK
jgi:hypothetical protein